MIGRRQANSFNGHIFSCSYKNQTKNILSRHDIHLRTKPETDISDWTNWKMTVKDFMKNKILPQTAPVFIEKSFDNRPYISVTLFDENVIALIDSGANLTCLGSLALNLLKRHKILLDKSKRRIVTTADGKAQKITGVCQLPLCINNICKIINVSVVPSLRCGLILGSDFCKTFSLMLNFQNNSWDIYSESNKLKVNVITELSEQSDRNKELKSNLSNENIIEMEKAVNLFKTLSPDGKLGRTNLIQAHIDTGDTKPFKKRQYRLSPYMLQHLNNELDKMIELDVIEPSFSPWNSPVLLVKKSNGEWRFCFDGRALNEVTKKDSYPLPFVDDILKMLANAKFISSIDLKSAFWQIPLDEESQEKTAFSIPGRGLFHFKVLPFGLSNSAQITQRLMDRILSPQLQPKVFVYLDDIIITSSTFAEHITLLSEVHRRLAEANLTVNFQKCNFFRDSLRYLGFVVDSQGLRTSSEKVKAMLNYPRPENTTQIRRFVGMCSWYRRFIPHFSTLISPLNDLLKGRGKKQSVPWNDKAQVAFDEIKQRLISAPVLAAPDFSLEFCIQCDASAFGVGSVLTQEQDGVERVIAYASRSLSAAERNYSTCEREILSLLHGCEIFRGYVQGVHFKVITDHASLRYLSKLSNPTGRLSRWALRLSMFDFEIIHRRGKFHVIPDALSRSVPVAEINTLGISLDELEPWYLKMRENINKSPEKYPQWMVKDGYIFKNISSKIILKTNISDWKLLVPLAQRQQVILDCHSNVNSGHLGYYKTMHRVAENFYWPKMRKDILKYVRQCDICSREKSLNTQRFGLMGAERKAAFPFQILAYDTMGPLPRSSKGNRFLLVAVDYFSKFVIMKAARQATAQAIVSFLEGIFLTYGCPQILLLDNASTHKSKHFDKFVKNYKIPKIWYNCHYHPQVNPVERVNRTIGTAIRCFLKDSHRKWDENISNIQMAINTAVHEVTGFSPAFLNFGRKVPVMGDYYDDISISDMNNLGENRRSYVNELDKLPEIYKVVQERLNAAYQRSSNYYNLRKRDQVFHVGEKVWKRNFVLSSAADDFSAKLANRYVLCTVRRVLSKVAYELENLDGTPAGKFHVSKLKPYLGSNPSLNEAGMPH